MVKIQEFTLLDNGIEESKILNEFTILPGNTIAIVGTSGSGNSLLLETLAGIEVCDRKIKHSVTIGENRLEEISAATLTRILGLVPRNPYTAFSGLCENLYEEIKLSLEIVGYDTDRIEAQILYVASTLELHNLLKRDPVTLSGGEAMRAAIAITLAKQPKIALLDRIFDQLDTHWQTQIRKQIREIIGTEAIIIETHVRGSKMLGVPKPDESGAWKSVTVSDDIERVPSEDDFESITQISERDEAALEVAGMNYKYTTSSFSLDNINLRVPRGSRVALVGPNGSGKSTLLKSIALLLEPSYRKLTIRTETREHNPPPKNKSHEWYKHVRYCFQNPDDQLYKSNIEDEIFEHGLGATCPLVIALIEKYMIKFKLDTVRHLSPFDVDSSLRRLVTICTAFAANPSLVLMDEPTAGLDDEQVGLLIELVKESGKSVIFISHNNDFIREFATDVILIADLKFSGK